MADAGETGGVQLVVLRDPVVDLLFARQLAGGKNDERAGLVDQLAVRFAVWITADLAALGRRGRFIDVPLSERGGIENVLMSAADQDDWILRRNRVEIAA